jgi:hypothetical protein
MKSAALYLQSHRDRLYAALDSNHEVSRAVDDLLTHMIRVHEALGVPFEDMEIRDVVLDDHAVLHVHLRW